MFKRKQMLKQLMDKGTFDILELKVLSSAHLEKDFTLTIGPTGILQYEVKNGEYSMGSRRKNDDGLTYFGVEDDSKGDEDDESSKEGAGATGGMDGISSKEVNDFIIPRNTMNPNETNPSMNPMMGGDGSNHRGRQFYIRYDLETNTYKIRDLGRGYGAFGKLQNPIEIRDSFLINIGESYVVSYLIENQDYDYASGDYGASDTKLKLKIFPPNNLDNPDVM